MCTKVTWSTSEGKAMDGLCWLFLFRGCRRRGGKYGDFSLEVACELIGTTEQTRGVRVVKLLVPTEEEEEEEED